MRSERTKRQATAVHVAFIVATTLAAGCRPGTSSVIVGLVNIADGAAIYTCKILGTAAGSGVDADLVEYALDDGEFAEAEGTSTWSITVPSGTAAWRVGSAHTLTIRVTDSRSETAESSYAFIRGEHRDLNGDGYRDLFVSAYTHGTEVGRVYVVLGASGGLPATDISTDGADITITGSGANMQFGYGLAVGDYNGDGYADIAATENKKNANAGAAYVLYGGPDWVGQAEQVDAAADVTILGQSAGDYFGYGAECVDLNGDGIDDLLLTAHYYQQATHLGRTYLFYGSASGFSDAELSAHDADAWITGETNGDCFGLGSVAADFNDDGYADLYTSAVGYNNPGGDSSYGHGRGYVFLGSPMKYSGAVGAGTASTLITGEADDDVLSTGSAGDFDGDGHVDLAVGAAGTSDYTGTLYVLYADSTGIASVDLSVGSADASIGGEEPVNAQNVYGDRFGFAKSGDANGDGFDDILAASRWTDSQAGRCYLFYGGATRLSGTLSATAADVIIAGGTAEKLGPCLVGDLNGDAYAELVLWTTPDSGLSEVRILRGSSAGISDTDFATDSADVVIRGGEFGDHFGQKTR